MRQRSREDMLRHALFDLDNTLYPPSCGLWEAIGHRISLFMIERLGMQPEVVRARRKSYLDAFGTTLAGLRHDFNVDPDDFLDFTHDLPLEQFLQYDRELDEMLTRLPLVKTIFTNADEPHARRVTERLGVSRHFERVVDIRALEWVNKPDPRAYRKTLEMISARAEECVFLEDSLQNLLPARALGMFTVLVGSAGASEPGHFQIPSATQLESILHHLETPHRGVSTGSTETPEGAQSGRS